MISPPPADSLLPGLIALAACALALLPTTLALLNLPFYRRLPLPSQPQPQPQPQHPSRSRLSVLIPARNEEHAIGPAIDSILAHPDPTLEVLVLDDHSSDRTAERVEAIRAQDPRVRLISGRDLPAGWCGKQHACWQLASAAKGDILVFVDADVRLSPDALTRLALHLEHHPELHLVSGVPRQITGTFLEKLLIPLIHLVLLGYLPMLAARLTRWPAFAAGCGQLFAARRAAYFTVDGHRSIRASLHDGVQLPRAFRRNGHQTGLFDATDIAACRMYPSAAEVWKGLGKNATEGLAQPAAILPWTVLLLGAHVLPWFLLASALVTPLHPFTLTTATTAAALTLTLRLLLAWRFQQSILGALLNPLGVAALVWIQWAALARRWRGQPMEWRGRQYAHAGSVPAKPHPTA